MSNQVERTQGTLLGLLDKMADLLVEARERVVSEDENGGS